MTTDALDFPPIEAPPLAAPPTAPVPVVAPAPPEGALAVVVATPVKDAVLAQFKEAETGIVALVEKYRDVAYNVGTTKGMAEAVAARADLRDNGKLALTRAETRVKRDVNDLKRVMSDEVDRLVSIVQPVHDAIDAQIKAELQRKADEKAARERIEAERVAAHRERLATITAYLAHCQNRGMTAARIGAGIELLAKITFGPEWQEFADPAAELQSKTLDAMNALHVQAVEREAEAARLEAQRVEQARVAAEQAEARRQIAEQEAAIRANVERVKRLSAMVAEIRAAATGHDGKSTAEMLDSITALHALDVDRGGYQEYHPLAAAAKRDSLMAMYRLHEEAQMREQAAAVIVVTSGATTEPPTGCDAIVNPQFADRFELFGGALDWSSADAIVDNPPATAPADPPAVDVTLALLAALKRLVVTLRAMDAETSAGGVPWEDDYQAALDQADAAIALAEGAA